MKLNWRAAVAASLAVAAWPVPATASDAKDCDAWAQTPEAWDEVEVILRENYAYLGRVPDVDALLSKAGASARKAQTVGELARIAETLGYAFRDGHFHVRPVSSPERAWIPSSSDFWTIRSGDRWIVADVKQGSDAAALGVRPGWQLISMDGEAIEARAKAALAPVEADPDAGQVEYAVNVVTTGFLGHERKLTFATPEGERTLTLAPAQQALGERPDGGLEITDHGGVARIRFHDSLGDNAMVEAFDSAMMEVAEARGLIIDLRDTPGGGNTTVARTILGHFVTEASVYQVHRNAYEDAVFGVPRQYAEYVFPRGSHFSGPVVVLAGRWTGSAGEALAMAFDRTVGATTIGSPLADLLGTLNRTSTDNRCLSFAFAWDSLFSRDMTPREDWLPGTVMEASDTGEDGGDAALEVALDWFASGVSE
ncbi:hypothetical protein CD351_14860 [Erythrobacter sp. KY5]|uniref:S41 family peptidase n=1 Tax=Erythrobacter sp. KY5 TaxID=2011159 RepID=UPI000DBF01F9|nr:S41 family peptidase [Erythrobacter sp. KY5]AWW75711.1 hypothetical protein CD351_14860 [Erythrobacter sp. KY5]